MSEWLLRAWRRWFAIPLSLRFAVGVWVALLLGVFGRVAVSRPDQQSVVPIYLFAAERLKANENLYADPPPGMDIYRNPPAVAALFVPFTFLDPTLAAILWRLIGISLYLWGLKQLIRDVLPPLSPLRRAWVWILSAVLAIPAFNNGQINLPVVATALLGTAAAARGAWTTAAVWLVIAGWFKVYTAAVGMLMSVAVPKQFFSRFCVIGFLIVGATWMGVEMWGSVGQDWEVRREPLTDFIQASRGDDRSAAPLARAPKDWTILARVWFDVVVPKPVSLSVSLVMAVGMAVWLFRHSRTVGAHVEAARVPPIPTGGRADRADVESWEGELEVEEKTPLPVAQQPTSPQRGVVGRTGFPNELHLFPLLLGLIWLTLFGPATEMNTYSVLAPVAAVLCVIGTSPFGVWGGTWMGTLMLVFAVVRGAFPQESGTTIHVLQPLGAVALLISVLQFGEPTRKKPNDPKGKRDRPTVELKVSARTEKPEADRKPARPPDPLEF